MGSREGERVRKTPGIMSESVEHPIRVETVTHRIGEAVLVENLSFSVRRGETLVLLGRSGSGKTTALRLINRMIEPSDGTVYVEGRATTDWDPIPLRRRIGYVIQEIGLFPHFTVAENVALVPALEGCSKSEQTARAVELLERVGLDPGVVAERFPDQLSGGQRQRVGVARALAADPPILLMDEPFGALDPITRSEVQREFLSMRATLDKTIVFVTHDVREGLRFGDRIAVIENGKVAWEGSPEEFRAGGAAVIQPYLESLQ